jgi:hypothetical protein
MSVDGDTIVRTVRDAVDKVRVADIHTHLFAPAFGPLLLSGIDELLTYHYLVAEALRRLPMAAAAFGRLDKRAQADLVWRTLFIERSPVSEACRGVVSALAALGLDPATRDLGAYRAFFARQKPEEHIARVFELSGVDYVVMTNDPFDDAERAVWMRGPRKDPRFRAALRLDALLNGWASAVPRLREWGFAVERGFGGRTAAEVRRFVAGEIERREALYAAVSLPPTFAFPEASDRARLLADCVLPAVEAAGVPLALMIGVRRRVNPGLGPAGDGLGRADVGAVEELCRAFPSNRFLVTMLSRENQHELCVAARKFANLMPFGCWWFLAGPGLVREITAMRTDLLGLSFIPQHSDARVLEQVIYKWRHARAAVAEVLAEKYAALAAAGWRAAESEIRRDAAALFAGNFEAFIARRRASLDNSGRPAY